MARSATPDAATIAPGAPEHPGTILVVEDEPGIATLERRRLERAGYTVALAATAAAALTRVAVGDIDLLVLDQQLSDGTTGLALYAALKAAGHAPPVIVVTGNSDEATVIEALRLGVHDFVTKSPTYLDHLPGAVAGVLARATTARRLAESERRFRGSFDHAAVGMALLAPDGRWVRANRAFRTLVGYREEELRASTLQDLTHPDDRAADLECARQLLAGERTTYQLEKRYLHKDGYPVWVLVSGSLVRDGADRPVYFIAQMQDITARRHAEAAQREAAESFAGLFGASEAIAINEGGRVVAVNPAYTALLGWELADVVGRPGADLVVPADRATADAHADAADERPYTVRLRRKDGATVPVEVVGRAIRYQGRPARLATLRDVTERVRVEAALRASEERFRAVFDAAPLGIELAGADGAVLRINRAMQVLLGYTEAELAGLSPADFTHPDDVAPTERLFRDLVAGRHESYRLEKRYITKGGETRWVHLTIAAVRDAEGWFLHSVSLVEDITARKEAEAMRSSQARHAALRAEVDAALAAGGAARALLQRCAEALVGHLDAAFARIWTLDEATQVLELQASAGLYTHLDGPHGRVPVGQFKVGLIAGERAPHLTNDVQHDPRVSDPAWAAREGLVAFAGYPLLVDDRVVGVLALFARRPFAANTLEALSTVAATLAQGLERKRAEAALRASEERFRSAFEHAAIGKALVGLDGRWLRVNRALCALLGYAEDALLTTDFQNLTHADDLSSDLEQVHRLLAGAIESYQLEKRYRHRGGHWIWALLSVSLVHDEAGAPLHFVAQIQDIGARKRAEAGLALLYAIAATANEAATLADAAGPALDRICAHTGWPLGHLLIGAGDGSLVATDRWHPDDPTSFPALRAASTQARFAPGEGLPGRTLAGREPIWIADIAADGGFVRGRGGNLGIRAAFAFPVLVGDEVVAVLEFFSPTAAAPDAALLALLAQIGTQLGAVVERERAGAALRRSEARHRAVVDTAVDAIVTASAAGLIQSFNLGAERIFGHDAREIIGESLTILMPARFRAGHSAGLARVGATGAGRLLGQTLELVGQRRDGTEFPLELTLAHGRDDQGDFFTGIMRDIGARVAAEAALRQGAESFASLFAATGEGLMIHAGGTILAANPAYAALHGCALAAVVGRDGLDFLAPASRGEAMRRMEDGDERPYEAEALHRDGTTFAVEFAGRAIRYQGRQARLVALRDITARKATEAALAASHRALEAKTREQEAFIYTVAHDLRAPLLAMQGMANILLEDYAPRLDDGGLYVERIVANAGKLQALLDELLELSRVGRVDVDLAPVALDEVVADVCAQLHHTLAARGGRVDVAGPLPIVRANRTRMVQLFTNLIANAIHYTPPERAPLVRIAAAPHADGWELTVADNGVGIPAAYRDKIFGLFQRLPAGKALNPGGTGAGLAIVARIVEAHGGTLWFDSMEGAGTTFHLTLSATPPPEPPGPPTAEFIVHLTAPREGIPA